MTATDSKVLTFDLHTFLEGARRSRFLVVDTEGNGKDVRDRAADPVTMGVTLTYRDSKFQIQSYYFPFFHMVGDNDTEFYDPVREVIRNHPCIIMHNAKHDLVAFELWDIFRFSGFYCTMTMMHLINENMLSYKLDYLSKYFGGEPKKMSDLMKGTIEFLGWGHVPSYMMQEYSAQDGVITLILFEKIYPEFCAQGLDGEYWFTEELWIWTISQMEKVGILVDSDLCHKEIKKGEKILQDLRQSMDGLNPLSPKDLYELLIKRLGFPIVKFTDKGKPSFDKEAMKKYEVLLKKTGSPVARNIITYRGWNKVVSTNYKPYINLQGKDGRIHPNYKIHGTVTRRLSSGSDSDGKTEVTSPNFQNIPRASEKPWDGNLKAAFIAEEGYTLYDVDQSQAEMRVGTAYSGDPKLLEIFLSGKDLFDGMAEDLGWKRQDVKIFNYATGYGAQDERVADLFGIPLSDAHDLRMTFNNTYAQYVKCKYYVADRAQKRLYIKYWTGARRHFLNKWEAKHKAWNSLNQGGVAELIKYQAVEIGQKIDWDTCRMLLQVHDNLCFEIKNGTEDHWLPIIKNVMETPPTQFIKATLVEVPFKVDVKKWGTEEKWQMALEFHHD